MQTQNPIKKPDYLKKSRFFLIPPMFLIISSLIPGFGGQNIILFGVFFIIGFIFAVNPKSQETIDDLSWFSLTFGIITYILELTAFPLTLIPWTLPWALQGINYYFSRWLWVIAIMGLGHKFIHNKGKVLQYMSDASYPLYILHATVLGFVSFWVFSLHLSSIGMLILIIVLTYLGIFLLYEFLVRRTRIGRVLFGMKPKIKTL